MKMLLYFLIILTICSGERNRDEEESTALTDDDRDNPTYSNLNRINRYLIPNFRGALKNSYNIKRINNRCIMEVKNGKSKKYCAPKTRIFKVKKHREGDDDDVNFDDSDSDELNQCVPIPIEETKEANTVQKLKCSRGAMTCILMLSTRTYSEFCDNVQN